VEITAPFLNDKGFDSKNFENMNFRNLVVSTTAPLIMVLGQLQVLPFCK
jgi:hypothetical protein